MEKLLHWLYRDRGQLTTVVARGSVLVTISAGHLTPLVSVFDSSIKTGKPLWFSDLLLDLSLQHSSSESCWAMTLGRGFPVVEYQRHPRSLRVCSTSPFYLEATGQHGEQGPRGPGSFPTAPLSPGISEWEEESDGLLFRRTGTTISLLAPERPFVPERHLQQKLLQSEIPTPNLA